MADPLATLAKEAKATAPPKASAEPPDAKVDAIRDLFAAMKSGDAEAGALAFERAYMACAEHHEGEEEDDEEYDLGV